MTTRRKKKEDRSDPIQGEGDYRSAREFNEKERTFVHSHDTEQLAEEATPDDAKQAAEMERAERAGKARARPDPETTEPGKRDQDGTNDVTPP